MHRFHISPAHWNPEALVLEGEEAHHCTQVVRCRAGEKIVVFNGEGPPDSGDVEGTIFTLASNEYNSGNAQAAGTVAFRGMMNLYGILSELGADDISSDRIIEVLRSAENRESFWGHPYTCDGEQVPGLQSLCAPQQTLFTIEGSNATDITFITEWIDTVALFEAAFAE